MESRPGNVIGPEDLLDATADPGECQASLDISEPVRELGKTDEEETPWAGSMDVRALADAALVKWAGRAVQRWLCSTSSTLPGCSTPIEAPASASHYDMWSG